MGFILVSLLGLTTIAITTLIAYEMLGWSWNTLPRLQIPARLRILVMMVPIFATHIIGIWVYALTYMLLERYTALGTLTGVQHAAIFTYESFMERLYFSASTYASLGLGDIAPMGDVRMIAAAEVLNGLVLIGWTISFTYLAMEQFWGMGRKK